METYWHIDSFIYEFPLQLHEYGVKYIKLCYPVGLQQLNKKACSDIIKIVGSEFHYWLDGLCL